MERDRTQGGAHGIIRRMTPSTSPLGLIGSDVPLATRYDVALLDLDGVVYVGPDAVPGAPAALAQVRALGMRLAFVTNNAARPPKQVAEHLTRLEIPAAPNEVITSSQAAAHHLAERLPTGSRVLVVGTDGLVEALLERGLTPVDHDDATVAAIVQGFSPDLTWRQLAQGSLAINRGALWVATNLDPTVPSPLGPLPGNGSLVAALRHATGAEPVSTGKPDPAMHRESVERSGAQRPIVVGDRLDTDIEGANAVGCASLLVFTGVTDPAQLLAAGPQLRPSYLAEDVGGLLATHRQPQVAGDRVDCGAWSVHVQSDRDLVITLTSRDVPTPAAALAEEGARTPDARLDALRALCVAAWSTGQAPQYRGGDEPGQAALRALGLG
jgi:glycerol 3-phosphatase-2